MVRNLIIMHVIDGVTWAGLVWVTLDTTTEQPHVTLAG